MGSLQEQLLKAGLVSEQKLKENRAGKRRKRKAAKGGKATGPDEGDLARAYAERARLEQIERDRELNRKREAERQRRELNARLKQIVLPAAKNEPAADMPRHFEHNGKIRKVYVTRPQLEALNTGQMGIAYLQGRYHVVDAEVIKRVHELKPEAVALFALFNNQGQAKEQADDYYQDERFQIPDDLIW